MRISATTARTVRAASLAATLAAAAAIATAPAASADTPHPAKDATAQPPATNGPGFSLGFSDPFSGRPWQAGCHSDGVRTAACGLN